MSKPEINQEVYDRYLDASVALFMEYYSAMLTEKISSEENTETVPFPEALDLKCKALFKKEAAKQKRLTLWKHTKRTLKVAAVFAIAVMTTFSMLFVSVDAFRVKVMNFYIEHGDSYWSISSNKDSNKGETNVPVANFDKNDPLKGLIPGDYVLTTISNADPQRITATYERSGSDMIRFLILPYDASLQMDAENAAVIKEIKILDHDGVLSIKKETSKVTWLNKATGMMYMIISTKLQEADLTTLAEETAKRVHG